MKEKNGEQRLHNSMLKKKEHRLGQAFSPSVVSKLHPVWEKFDDSFQVRDLGDDSPIDWDHYRVAFADSSGELANSGDFPWTEVEAVVDDVPDWERSDVASQLGDASEAVPD
ncbi:uncharacterized protein G2W53_014096 [Senna tora]|uniref:Uncharacterized protein n=1 Tax=Senna tora TaxID=362788 RepID=A0A834TZV7_9FABA|nr:uncharacterized protein G2W53_014096 [Senna tora]